MASQQKKFVLTLFEVQTTTVKITLQILSVLMRLNYLTVVVEYQFAICLPLLELYHHIKNAKLKSGKPQIRLISHARFKIINSSNLAKLLPLKDPPMTHSLILAHPGTGKILSSFSKNKTEMVSRMDPKKLKFSGRAYSIKLLSRNSRIFMNGNLLAC